MEEYIVSLVFDTGKDVVNCLYIIEGEDSDSCLLSCLNEAKDYFEEGELISFHVMKNEDKTSQKSKK